MTVYPVLLEELHGDATEPEVVLDHENSLVAPGECRLHRDRSVRLLLVDDREVHAHRRSDPDLGVHSDITAHLPCDAIDGSESEAGALATGLRREHRIEHSRLDVFGNASARVLDLQHGVGSRAQFGMGPEEGRVRSPHRGPNCQLSSMRHRVAGIHDQVGQDLFDLSAVHTHVFLPSLRARSTTGCLR